MVLKKSHIVKFTFFASLVILNRKFKIG